MTFEDDFLDMMPEEAVYAAPSAASVSGDRTYSPTTQTVRCRIQSRQELTQNEKGQTVTSMRQVFLAPTDVTGAAFVPVIHGRLTLPASYTPREPQIVSIDRENDDAPHHVKVYL